MYENENEDDTTHRRNIPFFGSMMSSMRSGRAVPGAGGMGGGGAMSAGQPRQPNGAGGAALNVNSVAHARVSPTVSVDYAAQNSFRKMPDE